MSANSEKDQSSWARSKQKRGGEADDPGTMASPAGDKPAREGPGATAGRGPCRDDDGGTGSGSPPPSTDKPARGGD